MLVVVVKKKCGAMVACPKRSWLCAHISREYDFFSNFPIVPSRREKELALVRCSTLARCIDRRTREIQMVVIQENKLRGG